MEKKVYVAGEEKGEEELYRGEREERRRMERKVIEREEGESGKEKERKEDTRTEIEDCKRKGKIESI